MRSYLMLTAVFLGLAGHVSVAALYSVGKCVYPEICQPPDTTYAKVLPVRPRMQWNTNGGFCGALSIQTMAMTFGAWLSQDVIRKANKGGPCFGHTSPAPYGISGDEGCEVGPENYHETATALKLDFDEWDWRQPKPQAEAFKRWVKRHIVKEQPVMWVPMEKGNSHSPNAKPNVTDPPSCPGGGHFDHHEPIIGVGSNHPLSDGDTLFEDDWVVHFSDYDLQPCYRTFASLDDTPAFDGNCRNANKDLREMFPCFNTDVTYGLALKGLKVQTPTLRVFLDVDRPNEPNPRMGEHPVDLHGTVRVQGLVAGGRYVLYRYGSTQALPLQDLGQGYEHKTEFVAKGGTWSFQDPDPFLSTSATYYVAVPASEKAAVAFSLSEKGTDADEPLILQRAPLWPPTERRELRHYMLGRKYQGGSRTEGGPPHETLLAVAPAVAGLSRSSGPQLLLLALAVLAVPVCAALARQLRGRRTVQVPPTALG